MFSVGGDNTASLPYCQDVIEPFMTAILHATIDVIVGTKIVDKVSIDRMQQMRMQQKHTDAKGHRLYTIATTRTVVSRARKGLF